jgi:hypothetical protein
MTRSRHPLAGTLSAAVLVLGFGPVFVAAANAQSPPTSETANASQTQALENLSATRDRPLFSPSRRPPAPPPPPVEMVYEPPPPPPPPPAPDVTLFGVVVDGDGARAIIRAGTAEMQRVQIGDEIGGWTVSQIEGRQLVLSLDGRLATFTLFNRDGAAAAAPAPPPAKRR